MCLIRNKNCLLFVSTWVRFIPSILVRPVILNFLVFCLVFFSPFCILTCVQFCLYHWIVHWGSSKVFTIWAVYNILTCKRTFIPAWCRISNRLAPLFILQICIHWLYFSCLHLGIKDSWCMNMSLCGHYRCK